MNNEKISVIVPVFNMEQYLKRCMASLLNQTYQNLEIILVDDGSTDNSPKLCDEYADTDDRVKVIHKTNGGLSDARNAGLLIATGDYIGYVDSDDWIEPQMYQKMYEACKKNNAQIAVCKYANIIQGKRIDNGTKLEKVLTRDELLKIYIAGDEQCVIYNSVWSKLFLRNIVENETFPVGHNSEDIMYTTKAFCKVDKAVYIDECFYNYVLDRQGSIMNVKRGERMFRDEIPFWREHISYIREYVSDEMGDLAAYHFYRRMLFYYIDLKKDIKNEKKARDYAKKLVDLLKHDRKEINRIYSQSFIAKGDYVRMKLMQISPRIYAACVKIYDKWIIPLRGD